MELRVPAVAKARELLGFEAKVDLDEGIRRTAEYYRAAGAMIRLTVPTIEEDDLAAVRTAAGVGLSSSRGRASPRSRPPLPRNGSATEHVVVVSSGTAALHLALLALGIGPGDRVAVPAYSWLATANVVEICGRAPVFVDIEPQAYAIDPDALERRPPARAACARSCPVHPFGQLADMSGLAAAAPGVPVVEDAAAALGAEQGGRPAGSLGQARLLLLSPAQGGDDRRGRGGHDE